MHEIKAHMRHTNKLMLIKASARVRTKVYFQYQCEADTLNTFQWLCYIYYTKQTICLHIYYACFYINNKLYRNYHMFLLPQCGG